MERFDGLKYWFFRYFILIGSDIMGLVAGKILLWVIASFLPPSLAELKQFLISDLTGSAVAAVTMAALLAKVFYSDGKKHAAYEDMDIVSVAVCVILFVAAYFVPVIFYNPADSTRVADTLYYMFYFPCRWIMTGLGTDIKTAAAAGISLVLGLQLVIYYAEYARYKRKHPFMFKESDEDEEEDIDSMEINS